MGQIFAIIFAILALGCAGMMIASFFTIRAAFVFREATKAKGVLFWGGACISCIILAYTSISDPSPEELANELAQEAEQEALEAKDEEREAKKELEKAKHEAALAEQKVITAEKKAQDAAKEANMPITSIGIPLTWEEVRKEETTLPPESRKKLSVTIVPTVKDQSTATQKDFWATLVQAAEKYQKQTGYPIISLKIIGQKADNQSGEGVLASATFIPDEKGYDGKEPKGPWDAPLAAKRGYTEQELKYLRLWAELLENYQKGNSTDEKALAAEIEKKMEIIPGSVDPHSNALREVNLQDISSTQEKYKPRIKEINIELSDFRYNFNLFAQEYDIPKMPDQPDKKEEDKTGVTHFYNLTDKIELQYHFVPGTQKPLSVLLIGTKKDTAQSEKNLAYTAMAVVVALSPDLSTEERKVGFRTLALLPWEIIKDEQKHEWQNSLAMFTTRYSNVTGLILTAKPLEQN